MGNIERNSFVKEAIINTTIFLLEKRDFEDISISDIVTAAQVSRNSFYRNFSEKEDIIRQRIATIMNEWNSHQTVSSTAELYGALFEHLKQNSDFYLMLKKRKLFYLFQQEYLSRFGAKTEFENMWAYTVSFIACGTLGWIEEWIGRGMQESAETMAALLSSNGMK